MSDYIISQIYPSDILANKQINELLLAEGIRRDANLDYTCDMYAVSYTHLRAHET